MSTIYTVPVVSSLKPGQHLRLPGSKSITNRALILSALASGTTLLSNVLEADDPLYMYQALQDLGYHLEWDKQKADCRVLGGMLPHGEHQLYTGNAGTAMRFLSTLLCLGEGVFILDGDARMRERPAADLLSALHQLGCQAESINRNGCPPLSIRASGIEGGHCRLPGANSSQYLSALLLAGPYCRQDLHISIEGEMASQPYVDMTLQMMRQFGVEVERQGYREFRIRPAAYTSPGQYRIEPDASAASYFMAAAAILNGEVTLEGLGRDSLQGDTRFAEVLQEMGAQVTWESHSVHIQGQGRLRGLEMDMNAIPDMVLTLAVVALFAEGPTTIRNVPNLRIKETDRIHALCQELTKLGAGVDEFPDGLRIHPCAGYQPASISTYHDHRMAMSFTLAGLRISGVVIEDPGCVSKTFPGYFTTMEQFISA